MFPVNVADGRWGEGKEKYAIVLKSKAVEAESLVRNQMKVTERIKAVCSCFENEHRAKTANFVICPATARFRF